MLDLSLYLVTPTCMAIDNLLKIVQEAVEGGITIVQFREKERAAREMVTIGRALLSFLKPLGIPLIINDRVDVAHAIGADGIHLGQADLTVSQARQILGKRAIIGLSVESLEQLGEAFQEKVDYLAASPVFKTESKKDHAPPWGLEGLRHLCKRSPFPVVAIGGIHQNNVHEVMKQGVAGVAAISSICHAASPKKAAQNMKEEIINAK